LLSWHRYRCLDCTFAQASAFTIFVHRFRPLGICRRGRLIDYRSLFPALKARKVATTTMAAPCGRTEPRLLEAREELHLDRLKPVSLVASAVGYDRWNPQSSLHHATMPCVSCHLHVCKLPEIPEKTRWLNQHHWIFVRRPVRAWWTHCGRAGAFSAVFTI
jgi:hypothetical protein